MISNNPKTLDALLMDTGGVEKVADEKEWMSLAGELKKVFHTYLTTMLPKGADYYAPLCTVYCWYGKPRTIKPLARKDAFDAKHAKYRDTNLDEALEKKITAAADAFVNNLMNGNGQWAYLLSQDWYRNGDYVVAIDINYYPDRAGSYKIYPSFHKDTGGNNIFVNLVFDNDSEIEATEWYTDLDLPSTKRQTWQDGLLPTAHVKALEAARAALTETAKEKAKSGKPEYVNGGTSDKKNTYVSWVDDLVWHATPVGQGRIRIANKAATDYLHEKLEACYDNGFAYFDAKVNSDIHGLEIIGTMSELPGPYLADWLTKNVPRIQDITEELAKKAWGELYRGSAGKTRFDKDVEKRLTARWAITGVLSEANAFDPNLKDKKSESVIETPQRLSLLERTNSDPNMKEKLARIALANKGKTRSFIRTWVRILKKDDGELKLI
jgi:hypothetical protein